MEFTTQNLFNTTTQMSVTSNTITVKNLFNPDIEFQYKSDGFNDDNTTSSIVLSFDSTTNVSRIALKETNLKSFTIFYNGTTANTFSLTSTGSTNASDFSTNSETAMYMRFSTTAVSKITIDMKTTQSANAEKAIGFLYVGDLRYIFEDTPSAQNYNPLINRKDVAHTLSDGGVRLQYIQTKQQVNMKMTNISETFRDNLKTIYDLNESVGFAPFPTMASWDQFFFVGPWINNFDFFKHSDNAVNAGFTGNIQLRESTE